MRILFVTQEDPFYIKVFFENFLEHYEDLEDIAGVVICKTMGKNLGALLKQLYDFYGPLDFTRVFLRYLKNKTLAKVAGVFNFKKFYDLKQILKYYRIRTIPCRDINDPVFLETVQGMRLDLVISVAAPQIFGKPLLESARHGCINIHNAMLPAYRGMLPNFWNMYNDEKNSAITIHTMNEKIDDGRILAQKAFEIDPRESLDALIRRTKALGAASMREVIQLFKNGNPEYLPRPDVSPSYYSFPTRKDVINFRSRGKRLL